MSCKLLLILAGILVLALVNAPNTYASPPGSGCGLLTSAQIQKALGQSFDAAKETELAPPFGNQPAHTAPIEPNEAGTWL